MKTTEETKDCEFLMLSVLSCALVVTNILLDCRLSWNRCWSRVELWTVVCSKCMRLFPFWSSDIIDMKTYCFMSHYKLSTDQRASIHSLSEIDMAMYTPHGQITLPGPRHLRSGSPCTGTCYVELGIRHDSNFNMNNIDGYSFVRGVTSAVSIL